ncbi:unnamed protein product [Ilex paraguariensis]|uniref:Uncharacterized protein n=1 Tax=Ilex paraguariensis TaxID=185542 RepID=A0ABC8R1I4_9AQUA
MHKLNTPFACRKGKYFIEELLFVLADMFSKALERKFIITQRNDNIENSLDSFRKAFDVVYVNDANMWGVVKLAYELCSTGSN